MTDSCHQRLRKFAERWNVDIDERIIETASSLVAYGRRGDDRVVLKIVRRPGDEWRAGETLRAFGGRGMVRALETDEGAMLLERLSPGHSLVDVVLHGEDDRATSIFAAVMCELSPESAPTDAPTVGDWGRAFEWYLSTGDRQVPSSLVEMGHRLYLDLCETQTSRRLLHGDLQHTNIRFDDQRGWVAIDPKGVIGEPEFEAGAFLRNPKETPGLFNDRETVERRLRIFCEKAHLSYERALRWAFAEAVLSAIWGVEDDGCVREDGPSLTLARALRPAINDRL